MHGSVSFFFSAGTYEVRVAEHTQRHATKRTRQQWVAHFSASEEDVDEPGARDPNTMSVKELKVLEWANAVFFSSILSIDG